KLPSKSWPPKCGRVMNPTQSIPTPSPFHMSASHRNVGIFGGWGRVGHSLFRSPAALVRRGGQEVSMVTHTFRGLGLLGLLGLILGALLVARPAQARRGFAPIPSDQTGGKVTGLELRIVRYDGSTNGVIEVEVKNTRNEPTDFSARGLYF